LQLAILMENMRRENHEFGVSKPRVITKQIAGKTYEPFEEITMDLPEAYSGAIIRELNQRKGMLVFMENLSETFVRIKYEIPTRGFIGFRNFFLTETRGEGSLSGIFLEYRPYAGDISERKRGALVSMESGMANSYGLFNLQERGDLFIGPQTPVYAGMIVGLHSRENDLDVNPMKEKKMTNVRASGTDEAIRLIPPLPLNIELAMDTIQSDEIIEITPHSIRLRKRILDVAGRKRSRYATA
jgi:GTP-binding protein